MVARVAEVVRRVLGDDPATEVRYTEAIAADSFYLGTRDGRPVLYLHPNHRQLVDELRAGR